MLGKPVSKADSPLPMLPPMIFICLLVPVPLGQAPHQRPIPIFRRNTGFRLIKILTERRDHREQGVMRELMKLFLSRRLFPMRRLLSHRTIMKKLLVILSLLLLPALGWAQTNVNRASDCIAASASGTAYTCSYGVSPGAYVTG